MSDDVYVLSLLRAPQEKFLNKMHAAIPESECVCGSCRSYQSVGFVGKVLSVRYECYCGRSWDMEYSFNRPKRIDHIYWGLSKKA
jgi:hypothetical protein